MLKLNRAIVQSSKVDHKLVTFVEEGENENPCLNSECSNVVRWAPGSLSRQELTFVGIVCSDGCWEEVQRDHWGRLPAPSEVVAKVPKPLPVHEYTPPVFVPVETVAEQESLEIPGDTKPVWKSPKEIKASGGLPAGWDSFCGCVECGGPRKGRGWSHSESCSLSTANKLKAKRVSVSSAKNEELPAQDESVIASGGEAREAGSEPVVESAASGTKKSGRVSGKRRPLGAM